MADSVLRQKKSQRYRIYRLIAVSLGVLLSSQSIPSQQEKHQDFKHTFSVGLEYFHYHYDETVDKKKFMDIKGLDTVIKG